MDAHILSCRCGWEGDEEDARADSESGMLHCVCGQAIMSMYSDLEGGEDLGNESR